MRFGVLGPLAVWTTDGRRVRIPERKVRALLANLLAHDGQVVSADRLIDDLWPDGPPGNPSGALQAKVSQLRRALEDAEPGSRSLVVARRPGYELQADAVDAGRFAALTARARAADDHRVRVALLGEAMALWRGPAFADFADEAFTQAPITRLTEERLLALEEQAEARLELGEHSQLVSDLGEAVASHPLRERMRAAQMRALYRAGRQSEALASYDELRARLAEELGLDPSLELAALHQAILTQDPGLAPAPEPAPTASAARPRTNLPATLTELIGRDGAVAEIRALLNAGRLVTLTGSGGVGKTRLAVETASRHAGAFPDGAWLVELAALDLSGDAAALDSLTEAFMTVLGIREDAAAGLLPTGIPVPPIDRLISALRTKQLLLVMDNCEHVIEPTARLAELLLRAVPGLRLLTTSQEPLAVDGEALWTVPPLELPDQDSGREPEILEQAGAVRLFVARAAAAAPGFALDAHNGEAVAAICRRLDGIPLALELAATRVRVLGVHTLLSRLDDRFRLLDAGHRGAPPRQQTLRSMIDWSWELLTEPEQAVLRRLAVHAEGCTLEAAEAVCAGQCVQAEDVLSLLARLVDRSLVVVTESPHGPRYRLLESVALYCLERLREAEEFAPVRLAHQRYYTALAEEAEPHLRGHAQRRWLERLDLDSANLRTALDGDDIDLTLRLVNTLTWYWILRGRLGEARRSLEAALTAADEASRGLRPGGPLSARLRARASAWHTGITIFEGNGTDRAVRCRGALEAYEKLDDPRGEAEAQWFLGHALCSIGDLAGGEDLIDRALDGFRALGDRWGEAAALSDRAQQRMLRGDLAAVERDGEASAELFRKLGDHWGQLRTVPALATWAEIFGDYDRAARLLREGLGMAERLGMWTEAADLLTGLGRIALLVGDHAQARVLHERSMGLAAEQGFRVGEVNAEVGLGLGARREGELDIAEAHMRNVLQWHRRMGLDGANALILAELGFIAEQRGEVREALALQLEGFDVARATGDPRALALALEGLAGAQALAGHHIHAAQLLGAAAAARESTGAPLPPAERGDVDRITAAGRGVLGAEAFTTAFGQGGGMEPEEYVALADRGRGPL
ncbi:winged helix-turn-helix domain-containing protein [Streptomyces sp. A3M-1-3]|uniref:BTAD domain-containing putative transcriptional regulator n=1 Tax=Streptomyces sp. A3M-1-3 TaxID=2962044 RepID=UPI0020B7FBF1|nr:BTAD domain-containing putative transcriptional regulator [Streptomyces sp. A3M-1-3]MCP3822797.1 winged helix-turn-helix domain-containing protein [Streptomyces sp. A3M-1-3]